MSASGSRDTGPGLGPWAALELDPDPAAVRQARAFIARHCRARGACDDLCDTAVLLASEIVTNAFLHGRSRTRLAVATSTTHVRVEVSDDNSRHPITPAPDTDALDGRGITIVQMLASAWGVRDEPLGKTVWFQIDT